MGDVVVDTEYSGRDAPGCSKRGATGGGSWALRAAPPRLLLRLQLARCVAAGATGCWRGDEMKSGRPSYGYAHASGGEERGGACMMMMRRRYWEKEQEAAGSTVRSRGPLLRLLLRAVPATVRCSIISIMLLRAAAEAAHAGCGAARSLMKRRRRATSGERRKKKKKRRHHQQQRPATTRRQGL